MDFGWHLPCYGPLATRENLIRVAQEAEACALESVFVSDHLALPFEAATPYEGSRSGAFPIPPTAPFLEPLTALAVVAAGPERVSLATPGLVLPRRHPVLAAKTIATLDHLSGGRVIVGVGVGWLREEIEMLGVPYERRGAWSDEALDVMKRCWADERSKHAGEFFRFGDVGCYPKPVQKPYPPIWLGGRSPAAYLREAGFGSGFHSPWSFPFLMTGQNREVLRARLKRSAAGYDARCVAELGRVRAVLGWYRGEPGGADRLHHRADRPVCRGGRWAQRAGSAAQEPGGAPRPHASLHRGYPSFHRGHMTVPAILWRRLDQA